MFTLAACVHLIGCTFYGIFASGELQPWAEPPAEEQQVWAPPAGAITHGDDPSQAGMMGNYMKETSFVSQARHALGTLNTFLLLFPPLQGAPEYTEQSQMQQSNAISYGATGHVANNPFALAAGAPIVEEPAQPSEGYGYTDYTQGQANPSTNPYEQQAYQQQ